MSLNALSGIGCVRTLPEAGRPLQARGHGVLMPCRALGAFGRFGDWIVRFHDSVSLNALSGIGCVRTLTVSRWPPVAPHSLNALSGIGCVRTLLQRGLPLQRDFVLMPCRALGAFGRLRRLCSLPNLLYQS